MPVAVVLPQPWGWDLQFGAIGEHHVYDQRGDHLLHHQRNHPGGYDSGHLLNGHHAGERGAVSVSASETLEAIATESGFTNSAVASATYTIGAVSIAFAQVAAATPQ